MFSFITEFPFVYFSSTSRPTHKVTPIFDYPSNVYLYDHCGFIVVKYLRKMCECLIFVHPVSDGVVGCTTKSDAYD